MWSFGLSHPMSHTFAAHVWLNQTKENSKSRSKQRTQYRYPWAMFLRSGSPGDNGVNTNLKWIEFYFVFSANEHRLPQVPRKYHSKNECCEWFSKHMPNFKRLSDRYTLTNRIWRCFLLHFNSSVFTVHSKSNNVELHIAGGRIDSQRFVRGLLCPSCRSCCCVFTFWSPKRIWRRAFRLTFIRHRNIRCSPSKPVAFKDELWWWDPELVVCCGTLRLSSACIDPWSCLSIISYTESPWINRSSCKVRK